MFAFMKRVFLFAVVNILVLLTLSFAFNILVSLFGLQMTPNMSLWIWYGVLGMGGAFINLLMSRSMAKWMMGVQVIDPNTHDSQERRLLEMVNTLAQRARLPAMPEVGIYDSPDVNAFATGPSKSRALVAVSTGLLSQMDADSVEGVLGHEITHIANGDMVTMTLIQGVINTMVLIAARIITSIIVSNMDERSRPVLRMFIYYMLQVVLSIFGSMVVCYFSRAREFRADAGGARLAGRERMIAGLKRLQSLHDREPAEVQQSAPQSMASLQIAGRTNSVMALLFATHPPLDERIRRLETMRL